MEGKVLLHRLPIDLSPSCSFPDGPSLHQANPVQRVPLRLLRWVLLSLDLIGVMVLTKVVFQSLEWSGLHGEVSAAAFVAANLLFWLFAASVVQLYSLSRMISGQGMAIPTIITLSLIHI